MPKVVITGAGRSRASIAAALALANVVCGKADPADGGSLKARPAPMVLQASWGAGKPACWYQQFAGKKGKPPRY